MVCFKIHKMSIYQPSDDSYLMQDSLKKVILEISKNRETIKILEIGSGSGTNLKFLESLKIPKKNIFSCDINPEAVIQCKDKLEFNCIISDLFQNIPNEEFDLIFFNPPYLPEEKSQFKDKEPEDSKLATTGGKKGSEIINKFLKQASSYLKKEGKILLLTSSLTKDIDWNNWKKRKIATKNLFMEKLYVWELIQ